MRRKSNVVLLDSDSQESRQKAANWARAADALGLDVNASPDSRTVAILPCSDHAAVEAAWLCHAHDVPGPDPVAAAVASSKALAYGFLSSRGFNVLPFFVPTRERDFQVTLNRPVIVKPEHGSGTVAPVPWAYQVFDSVADFRRYLISTRQEAAFLAYQRRPHPGTGRFLIMEYVDTSRIHIVQCVIGDGHLVAFDQASSIFKEPQMTVESTVLGGKLRDADAVVGMAKALAGLGLRRTILIMQCLEHRGKLYPIDFNLRLGAMIDRFIAVAGLDFYARALEFFVGRGRSFGFSWPAPWVGLHRIYLPRRKGQFRAEFGPGCVPLMDRVQYDPRKPYDWGYSLPVFAVLCRTRAEIPRRIKEVVRSTVLRRLH